MARRRVRNTEKDKEGDITGLCGPDFGYRSATGAISDIENTVHSYYVKEAGHESNIHVVTEGRRKYLRTYADAASENNLDNLPDCL